MLNIFRSVDFGQEHVLVVAIPGLGEEFSRSMHFSHLEKSGAGSLHLVRKVS